jgi:hypothetical protein
VAALALAVGPGVALAQDNSDDGWYERAESNDPYKNKNKDHDKNKDSARTTTQNPSRAASEARLESSFHYYDCYNAGWDNTNPNDDWFFDYYESDPSCSFDTSSWTSKDYYDEEFGYNQDDDAFVWEETDLFVGVG